MEKITRKTKGLIIGKFLPPHRGHQYLIDFARHYVDELTVLVCSLRAEPIPGKLRYEWICEMFPDVHVVHHTVENPQEPHEHDDFWNIWKKSISELVPEGGDYLFASEEYGFKLGEVLGMQYIPVDHPRHLVPIAGSKIRENPMKYWEYIPPVVRPYYVKKVCIFGPESTGKSTLTKNLAEHFDTVYVSEYARGLLDFKDGKVEYNDIPFIAKGHIASEEALAKQANKIIFSDTDLITTTVWSDVLFGKCPEWITAEANKREYDLYLLTDIDVPWVKDNQRYLPNDRKEFLERCIQELKSRGRKYVIVNGPWDERFRKACVEVEKLLNASGVD